jgi:hypothetical protein
MIFGNNACGQLAKRGARRSQPPFGRGAPDGVTTTVTLLSIPSVEYTD